MNYFLVKKDDHQQTPLLSLNTTNAVEADYLAFIRDIAETLLAEKDTLEAKANTQNRTINHAHVAAFGSIPLDPQSNT